MDFKGRALLGLNRTTSDRNINWKVIIKSVTLLLDLSRSYAFPYHGRSCSSCTRLDQVLSYTSSNDKIPPWDAPIFPSIDLPWNRFYTASTFKPVHAIESGVRPSPFSPGYLCVFPRHRWSLGRDHPWSNTITGSFPTPMKLPSHTPLPLRLSWP